jgi:chorismate-pyruvate lyase
MSGGKVGSMYPPGFSRKTRSPERLDVSGMPRLLRTLLVADGTVTKLLEAHFWEPIDVKVTTQHTVFEDPFGSGDGIAEVAHREVVIVRRVQQRVLAFARSVIGLNLLEPELRAAVLSCEGGIGSLLRERRIETFREQLSVVARTADDFAALLEVSPNASVAERTYRIYRNHKPIAEIVELFPIEMYVD